MRFMIIVKASGDSADNCGQDEKFAGEMRKFNDELTKAGALLALEGLHPSSKGARVRLSAGKRTVIDGPFAETKELIGGYWLWEVKSKEKAIEWVKRIPVPPHGEIEIEIRQVRDVEEFGAKLAPSFHGSAEHASAAGGRATPSNAARNH